MRLQDRWKGPLSCQGSTSNVSGSAEMRVALAPDVFGITFKLGKAHGEQGGTLASARILSCPSNTVVRPT